MRQSWSILPCRIIELTTNPCLKFAFNWSGQTGNPARYIHHRRLFSITFDQAIRCWFLSLKSAELKRFVLLLSVFVHGTALPARAQTKKSHSCASGSLATAPMTRFVFSDSLLNCYLR